MDTKRKNRPNEIEKSVAHIVTGLHEFDPDIILLGDDNATNCIGNLYVDTDIPVIFWGGKRQSVKIRTRPIQGTSGAQRDRRISSGISDRRHQMAAKTGTDGQAYRRVVG